jgi:multiple sugar transport system permease protein
MTNIAPPTIDSVGAGVKPTQRPLDRVKFRWGTIPLLLPAAVLLVLGFAYPVGYAFYLGLTNLRLLGPTAEHFQFTGFANLQTMIHDPIFINSLWITLVFVIGSGVIGATAVGLFLAVVMRRAIAAARHVVGAVVIVAWMLPPVTIAFVWYAATSSGGTFGALVGHSSADLLYAAPLLIVCLANTWSLTGLAMLMFGAALRNIPEDIDEAAKLEGAGAIARFRRITLPLLKPTIITTSLLMTLLAFGNFTIVYILTGGGPNNATNILPVYSYQQGFTFNNLAYGALLGNVMVILAAILGFAYVRFTRAEI